MAEAFDSLAGLAIKDDHLRRVLRGQDFLVQDGGMGTMLQQAGLTQDGGLPDLLNLEDPQAVTAIHRAYVEAGAEMVTANTFGANARKLEGRASVAQVYAAAADCARASGARYVAGDIGPTGALLEPLGDLSFEEAYELFAEQVRAAAAAGCDLVAIETMSDFREAKAALLAAKENCSLPVSVTMTFGEDGRTFLGTPPEVAAAALSSLGAHLVGVNCSLGPQELVGVVRSMVRMARCPVVVQPNAGLPRVRDGLTVYDVGPEEFACAMARIVEAGASVLGGCCGTTPAHIERVAALVAGRAPEPQPVSRAFVVASAQRAVVLEEGRPALAVVGERINPTGKPRLKRALHDGDYDYLVGEAQAQQEAGADLLDVNVGLPELDEPAVLRAVVEELQAAVSLPLQVDSSDPAAIEAAVRGYAGKPLVNSASGKRESLDAVLPLVRRYGCAVVGLTLDEDGIPPTAEGRLRIAERIVRAAEEHGVPRCDVAIDCLAMAVATNQDEALQALCAVRLVKDRLGVRTMLGVSNVSFGLPQRNLMNATFLAAALGAGLDLPILNPLSARYRDTIAAFRVLNGQDRGAARYVEDYAQAQDPYASRVEVAGDGAQGGVGAIAAVAGGGRDATGGGAAADGDGGATVGGDGGGGGAVGSANGGTGDGTGDVRDGAGVAGGIARRARAGMRAATAADALPVPPELADVADQVRAMTRLVLTGRAAPLAEATDALLADHDALAVVNGVFVPALDVVGQKYESGEFFLPQLMAAAEAVKAGFDVVRGHRLASGAPPALEASDRIVLLATVEGDVHDIGKNIVRMLLENYGFAVVDLGRDVAPETIVAAVRERGIRLVGLSALMTTTVKAMERTVQLLHEQAPGVAVMVGGAVLTPEYARRIGADFYAKDAAASARIASEFFG